MNGQVLLPIPDDYLRAIGAVVSQFSLTEFLVGQLVGTLALVDQRVQKIMTVHLGARSLFEVWGALGNERFKGESLSTHQDLVRKANEIREKRDAIVHGLWAAGQSPGTVSRVRMSARGNKGFQFRREEFSISDMNALVQELSTLNGKLSQIWITLSERLKAREDAQESGQAEEPPSMPEQHAPPEA